MGGTDHYEKVAILREAERSGFLEMVEIVWIDRIALFDNMFLFSVFPICLDPITVFVFLSTFAEWKTMQFLP